MAAKLGPFKVEYLKVTNIDPGKVALLLNHPGKYRVAVAGISYRQTEVSNACRRGSRGLADLVYENDNPYDSNAVAVIIRGYHVGYLPKALNVEFREAMSRIIPSDLDSIPLRCPMVIIGGGHDLNLGMRLDLPRSSKQHRAAKRTTSKPKSRKRERLRLPSEFLKA